MIQQPIVGTFNAHLQRMSPTGASIWDVNLNSLYGVTTINCVLIDSNTNILVGTPNTTGANLYVFDIDGNYINSYLIGTGINCLALQPTGKILIGHNSGIVRLNTNYSNDGTFTSSPINGINSSGCGISALLITATYYYVAMSYNAPGWGTNSLLKFQHSDNLITTYYNTVDPVNCIALQNDDKLLAGTSSGIYRYNTNGTVDGTWTVGTLNIKSILYNVSRIVIGVINFRGYILDSTGNNAVQLGISGTNNIYTIKELDNEQILIGCSTLNLVRGTFVTNNYTRDLTFSSSITARATSIDLYSTVNTDATLSDIQVDGTTITGFSSGIYVYNIANLSGEITYPTITYTLSDPNATATLTFNFLTGVATIVTIAEDGITTLTYTLNFIKYLTIRRLLRVWKLKIPRDNKNVGTASNYDARIRNQNVNIKLTYGNNGRSTLGNKRIVLNDVTVVFNR